MSRLKNAALIELSALIAVASLTSISSCKARGEPTNSAVPNADSACKVLVEPFTFDHLAEAIVCRQARDVAGVVRLLPASMLSRAMLAYDSHSDMVGTPERPRVGVFDDQADLIFSFDGVSDFIAAAAERDRCRHQRVQ